MNHAVGHQRDSYIVLDLVTFLHLATHRLYHVLHRIFLLSFSLCFSLFHCLITSKNLSYFICFFRHSLFSRFGSLWRVRELEARAYNGELGTLPTAGYRGRATGQGVRGQAPLKLNTIYRDCMSQFSLLKTDRYMLRGGWQALNCLSIHATYCVIIAGVSPGEKNVGCGKWKRQFFALAVQVTGKLLR